MTQRANDFGFTLLEALVALVIFAAVIVVLERGSAIGLRGLRLAQLNSGAVTLARAKLASAGVDTPLPDDADLSGDEPPYHWRLTTRPYVAPEAVSMPVRMGAYWVEVTVSWRERSAERERTIALQTLKIRSEP